ncbi:NAD-dependent epimerase/dehydratase family protein [Actinomadura rubrisoli]|uniref:NAD(P)-dependent oxidoreductase n=1 Tax=Actinomadura rubrisoli TaxID=2530368 RepID=A0A4R5CCB5_9ACTN|nr:NAD(P)-dependent oxidoreductase [Actinomadura rubrisoli]TDD97621.1 NAD(P)-dependent oxidoreductase [Actinomadura rubrisoli]
MDVVVTGARGFLGRHLQAALEARGDYVLDIDVDPDQECNRDALEFFRDDPHMWDLAIHCAAVEPHRSAIDGRALAVGAGNLELDAAMFGWAARVHPGRLVYLSSSAAYPVYLQTGDYRVPLREHDTWEQPGEADAIYGAVKVMGERLARLYREQGGAVTVVRPFSGYGEDQSSDFPFGAFRDRARRREDPFVVWGDGTQVRDWIHVDDVVGAVLAAVDAAVDGPVNIATGIGTSMAELAEMFCAQVGYDPPFEYLTDRPAGVAYRVGDPTVLNEFYRPKVTLAEGVKRALARQPVNM